MGPQGFNVAFSSIGGVIGTGLFLGTATSLQNGGPIGLLLGYTVVGTITYSVMISLGEMVSFLPIPGGHIALAQRFVDSAFSFTMVSVVYSLSDHHASVSHDLPSVGLELLV